MNTLSENTPAPFDTFRVEADARKMRAEFFAKSIAALFSKLSRLVSGNAQATPQN